MAALTLQYRLRGADSQYVAGLMVPRKTNVETVPGDFQKAQLCWARYPGNPRIFAVGVDETGTGSRMGLRQLQTGLTNGVVR